MLYSVAMNSVEEERLLEETQVEDLTEEQREQTSSSGEDHGCVYVCVCVFVFDY